jgi:hypothetical protein
MSPGGERYAPARDDAAVPDKTTDVKWASGELLG